MVLLRITTAPGGFQLRRDCHGVGTLIAAFGDGSGSSEGQLSFVGNTVGYSGYLYDEIAELSLARNRWYSAEMGRWVSRDPEQYRDALNLMLYVAETPLLWTDPYGLFIYDLIEGNTKLHNWVANNGTEPLNYPQHSQFSIWAGGFL